MTTKTLIHNLAALGSAFLLTSSMAATDVEGVEPKSPTAKAEPAKQPASLDFVSLMGGLYTNSRQTIEMEEILLRKKRYAGVPYLCNWEQGHYSGDCHLFPFFHFEYDKSHSSWSCFAIPALTNVQSDDEHTAMRFLPLLAGWDVYDNGFQVFCLPLLAGFSNLVKDSEETAKENRTPNGTMVAFAGSLYLSKGGTAVFGSLPLLTAWIDGPSEKEAGRAVPQSPDPTHWPTADHWSVSVNFVASPTARNGFLSVPLLTLYSKSPLDNKDEAKTPGAKGEKTIFMSLPLLTFATSEKDELKKIDKSRLVVAGGLYGREEEAGAVENWALWGLLFSDSGTANLSRFELFGGLLYADERDTQLKRCVVSVTPLFRHVAKDGDGSLEVFRLFAVPMP